MLGLIAYYVENTFGYSILIPTVVGAFGLFGIYIMERFEEVLEDMDRMRVTQLAWIAETGGEDDAESTDYE